ncbi:MAG: hypothetical protein DI547_10650 [Sphingobium sp.]|nr:MAG: hypothetical protein DI547_10650 [Sphingobium sp.]
MAALGWILSFIALFGGLALRQDQPFAHAAAIAVMLFVIAFLAFPPVWADRPLGITKGQRITAAVAMLLAMPALYLSFA